MIARIIDNVSWSTEKKLKEAGKWLDWHGQCLELHCVQDADRLDVSVSSSMFQNGKIPGWWVIGVVAEEGPRIG